MSMSDPISDMLTRVRNALTRQHPTVSIPFSKMKQRVADVLHSEGYIEGYEVIEGTPRATLKVQLRYVGDRKERRSVITGIERVSKPGRRIYVGKSEIPWVLSGIGVAILTTSQGVMTGQQARRKGVGGEVLCKVW